MLTTTVDQQQGQYHIRVCTNVSCMLRGGDELLDKICTHYGIHNKERTKDGLVSIENIPCMGYCDNAPIVAVNNDFYEEVSVHDLPLLYDMIPAPTEI